MELGRDVVSSRENLVTVGSQGRVSTAETAKIARRIHLSSEALAPGQPGSGHPKDDQRKEVWQDSGSVFTGSSGVRLVPAGLKRHLTALCAQAGVRKATVHGLRHPHASPTLRQGGLIEGVGVKLGQAPPSFTADGCQAVYGNRFMELARW